MRLTLFFALYGISLLGWTDVTHYEYRVLERQAQSRDYFVQGLEFVGDELILSSGGYGKSALHRIAPQTGKVLATHTLHPRLFAEGITVLNDRIYQVTWRSRLGFIYALDDFSPIARFRIASEGWGLCNDGEQLVLSDGSDRLSFLNPETLITERSIRVTEHGKAVRRLNELEWIDGKIWANIWMTDDVVIINPTSGEVEGRVNLSGLLSVLERKPDTDVLNGIAWDANSKALWVTGKRWPWRYRIELVTPSANNNTTIDKPSRDTP